MGNVLPLPCTCKDATVVQAATVAGARRVKRKERPAAAKNVVVKADQYGVEEKEAPWPGCRVVEDGGVRLKVMMTRKEAAEFMARLQEQADAERESRSAELVAGGGVMSPCGVTWRPRLATIPESY